MQVRQPRRIAGILFGMALAAPFAALADEAVATRVDEIVVTAGRLDTARAQIQPQLGASVYTLDAKAIAAMPGGDNVGLNQVVLQSPGVAQDSFGQLHVRGEHNGLQFRLNGVILPEGLSVFSQTLNPRLADKVQLITGALPAQYGLRTAGIVDITTKSGVYANGGDVSVYGGSHGEIAPSFQVSGSSGPLNAFASGSYLRSSLGVESPDGASTPLHDKTQQFQGFAYVEDILDPSTRVSLIVGTSNQNFQIPNRTGLTPSILLGPSADQPEVVLGRTGFDSAKLDERQRETTHYGVVTWLHADAKSTVQVSLFGRYSSLRFTPDRIGDLLFGGLSQRAYRRDVAFGVQAEAVAPINKSHTLRSGLLAQIDRSVSRTTAEVIALGATGSQISDMPQTIIDNGAGTARTFSVYLQDEWVLRSDVTLNYGARFDQFNGVRDENQLSPRVSLVWTPLAATTVHAGYSRYFSPPPFELVARSSAAKFAGTTAAATCPVEVAACVTAPPLAERAHYFDLGLSQKLATGVTLGLDSYAKFSRNLVDEGQFGAPIILTPFNYSDGRQYGLEASLALVRGPLTAYANLAYQHSEGRRIVSSQFNFTPEDLAYIDGHYIPLDHDQAFTGSAGASYKYHGTRIGGDLIYGSGLRASPPGGTPNGAHLPGYVQVNLSLSHSFELAGGGALEFRLDVINAFDRIYEIRDGSGIGVGAPQFGARRGLFGGVTRSF